MSKIKSKQDAGGKDLVSSREKILVGVAAIGLSVAVSQGDLIKQLASSLLDLGVPSANAAGTTTMTTAAPITTTTTATAKAVTVPATTSKTKSAIAVRPVGSKVLKQVAPAGVNVKNIGNAAAFMDANVYH